MSAAAIPKRRVRRPTLRIQITLLYAGVFLAVLAAVLVGTSVVFKTRNVLFGTSASVLRSRVGDVRGPAEAGALAPETMSVHQFDPGAAAVVLVIAAVALGAAWYLAGRFLRPLRVINATAQEISATNLHRRLRLEGPKDELTELGGTLDGLFERLEASFESQRHFVANASHELRTPLAGQRTLLQVALADPDADAESLRATCEEALALGSQQERLIASLLTLASSERGLESCESLDLGRLTESALRARRREADRRGIRIDTSLAAAPISGDADLVESLIANLLDNAIRHNVAAGTVDISTSVSSGRSSVSVTNTGPRIGGAEVERLFQPFQRRRREHTGTGDGHGLGLAIVRAVTRAHGAELTATASAEGGLRIVVTFPPTGVTE